MSLDIIVVGNGAREQAIKYFIEKSPLCKSVDIKSELEVLELKSLPDLMIFGSEEPICNGLVDKFQAQGVKCIGVNKKFSQLESSKLAAKIFMANNGIRTAKFLPVESDEFPQVMKFDGLCKGKGVKVLYNNEEKNKFARKFPGMKYFLEEYLDGEEISVMSYLYNGRLINFKPARDFKRLSNDKNAPNTGGMGAYCPVSLTDEQTTKLDTYLKNLERALLRESADFNGFIYSGLIWARNDWYVLEYNVRLGDPECQAILMTLENDFLEILLNGKEPEYKSGTGAVLTISAQGYPDEAIVGDEITITNRDDVVVFYANVKINGEKLYSNGGRVLSICTNAKNPFEILKDFAKNNIQMEHKYFREDLTS